MSQEVETIDKPMSNSFSQLIDNLTFGGIFPGGAPLSQTSPNYWNNRWYLLSNDRQLISEMYVEQGLVQVLVDQPVDDAFSKGFDIKSSQLEENDVEAIKQFFEEHNVLHAIKQGMKWSRLYGGGGVLLILPEKPDTPFDINTMKQGTQIAFEPIDMWELYQDKINIQGDMSAVDPEDEFFHYYGKRVHKSRLLIIKGKEPPSFVKPRLRGWGMSELERLVRSLNQFLKNQNVVYELLDEAKIDIFRIDGLNSTLANSDGTNRVARRIQMANLLKNYNHALTMDVKDEYDQKVMNFSGLDSMLSQIRTSIAADLRIPMTKLFGMSAAGFNAGEDDIENYNAMIESEIRAKTRKMCLSITKIACQNLFGFIPDDIQIAFPSLRVMSSKEEEEVKTSKFQRLLQARQAGEISALDFKRGCNADDLLSIEVDETDEQYLPDPTSVKTTLTDEDEDGAQT